MWKIIKENIKLFDANIILTKLEREIQNHEDYKRQELIFLPREAFVECVIKVFYDLYYPTDVLRNKFNLWE